jgi:hypothetical protein
VYSMLALLGGPVPPLCLMDMYLLVIMIHNTLNVSVFVSCVIQSVGDNFGGSEGGELSSNRERT